jgi:hypothetical protein
MEPVLVGITREGKIFEKGFATSAGFLDIQFSSEYSSFSLNDKITCVKIKNKSILNGDEIDVDCVNFLKRYVKCIEDLLNNFYHCNNKELIENVKFLNEKIKYIVYLKEDDIIIPFVGEEEMDSLSFKIMKDYKERFYK